MNFFWRLAASSYRQKRETLATVAVPITAKHKPQKRKPKTCLNFQKVHQALTPNSP